MPLDRKFLVSEDLSLLHAMDTLTKTEDKMVFVVDRGDILLGTLTERDLRRFILAGNELSSSILPVFNRHPVFVTEGDYVPQELSDLFLERHVDVVPVVDKEGRVVSHLSRRGVFEDSSERSATEIEGVPIVIMAGGLGTRLQPFTQVLPKPLVPVAGKPMIDHIIEKFRAVGGTLFYVTVSYKAKMLRAYLHDADQRGITVIEEDAPLGTAGGLRLLAGRFDSPVLVTNCDVLLSANYRELLDFHVASGCEMTIVASMRTFRLPYGTCEIRSDGKLDRIEERPATTRLVNTGVYVMNPGVLDEIPPARTYDMTTLITDLMHSGRSVGVFPTSSEAWTDVGHWQEYQRATRMISDRIFGSEERAWAPETHCEQYEFG